MKNSEQPAFPTETEETETEVIIYHGLTKREYFAVMAMQGLLSSMSVAQKEDDNKAAAAYAKTSVMLADELLKQLES